MDPQIQKEIDENSLMENAKKAVKVIARPPRSTYQVDRISDMIYDSHSDPIPRIPITTLNRRREKIVGSAYLSLTYDTEPRHSCVIYLHGNIGTQQEGRFTVPILVPRGISVFCFDFSGSGVSDGEFVTLGCRETEDVLDVVDFLGKTLHVSEVVLWGRSMGAACALMAAPKHPLIKGIIVDSAYTSLDDLFSAIASRTPLPSFIKPAAVWWIKHEVQKMAHFDCSSVMPIVEAAQSDVPLLMCHASDDDFVPYSQGQQIFQHYKASDKEMMTVTGGHNGKRDQGWIMKCVRFILRVFERPNFIYFDVRITSDNVEHAASFAELMQKS